MIVFLVFKTVFERLQEEQSSTAMTSSPIDPYYTLYFYSCSENVSESSVDTVLKVKLWQPFFPGNWDQKAAPI